MIQYDRDELDFLNPKILAGRARLIPLRNFCFFPVPSRLNRVSELEIIDPLMKWKYSDEKHFFCEAGLPR